MHVSAMAADAASPSEWARTKAAGEAAVLEEFPEATIVRPCTLFGWEDRLLNWFAGIAGMPGALVPLVDDGASVLQPEYAFDVAKQKATLVPVPAQLADFAAGFMNLAPP